MPLTERDRACFGPRDAKPLGSLAWCWQTLDLLKTRWQRKDFTDQQFEETLTEVRQHAVWNVVPPQQPYGSLEALLLAELGQSVPAAPPQGTPCVTPPGPTGGQTGPPARARPLDTAIREVTRAYFGDQATFAYAAFDTINRTLFAGALPLPLVTWEITGYGRCLGLTQSGTRPPHIVLHPGTLRGASKPDPWKTPPAWLGPLFALDVLLHECLHVAVTYVRGGRGAGDSSHNCEAWVGEVNRVAPLLGFADVRCARSKPTRKGKVVTRQTEGNIALRDFATFPYGLRCLRETASAYYTGGGTLPRCPLPPWMAVVV